MSEDVSIANQEHPVQHAQTKRRSALGQVGRTVAFKELLALALALPHEPCTPPKMSREERGGNRGTHVKGDGKMGKQGQMRHERQVPGLRWRPCGAPRPNGEEGTPVMAGLLGSPGPAPAPAARGVVIPLTPPSRLTTRSPPRPLLLSSQWFVRNRPISIRTKKPAKFHIRSNRHPCERRTRN